MVLVFKVTKFITTIMYVYNANGTSRWSRPAGYSSWLAYWETYKGPAYKCSACGSRNSLVGAHVKKAYSDDNHYYIVPLCAACNRRTDIFYVDSNLLLPVPSNL